MTMAVEERVPGYFEVPAGALGRFPGRLLAEVAAGAVVRISDFQVGIVRAYLTLEPPAGVDPDLMPEVSSSEFGSTPGRCLALLAEGTPVKVIDRRLRLVRCYLTRELPAALQPVAGLIPEPVLADGSPPPGPGEKHCPTCKQNKPANAGGFHVESRAADGLCWQCRPCQNEALAASRRRRAARRNGQAAETGTTT